jgi:hypothetical protein
VVPESESAVLAEKRLHDLDAELEATRRRLWAVEHGLKKVDDVVAEVERLRARLTDLGDQFLVDYREWQAAGGRSDPGPTGEGG